MTDPSGIGERPGTGPVADRHRFDEAALAAWLRGADIDFDGALSVRQFAGGQSNPTFLLTTGSGEYVLRKQPPGKLLPSAHAVDREYRILHALAGSGVPVPRARAFCADASVIGTPFYLMDYQPGRIFSDPLLPGVSPTERRAMYDSMNEALARLHCVDWRALGLGDYGRPEQFVARQLARWTRQYDATRTGEVPAMRELRGWLEAQPPPDDVAAIVHGDFRIGNLIFDERRPAVVAVLDWELSTTGHPFSDLAFNCMTYHLPAGHPVAAGFTGADIAALGIPTEADYVAAYAARTGRDPSAHWRYFMAFSLYRTAAIQQGVYARSCQGNAASATAQLFGASYRMVAEAGCALVSGR